jgi:hypothetical protein
MYWFSATAVILSLTGNAPFHGTHDQNLSVAYISVFILVFMVSCDILWSNRCIIYKKITLFPFGLHRWVAWDFVGPDVEIEVLQVKARARRQRIFRCITFRSRKSTISQETEIAPTDEEKVTVPEITQPIISNNISPVQEDTITTIASPHDSIKPSATPLDAVEVDLPASERAPSVGPPWLYYVRLSSGVCLSIIRGLFNPISVAMFIALPISLVPTLKALFIPVEGVHMPSAPDGQPPLAFIQDTATFIGAASIPIGLICLGSSLARLNVPLTQWRTLPVGAIMGLAVGKMIIAPIFGVLISHGLANAGVIFKDDKVLLFVCMSAPFNFTIVTSGSTSFIGFFLAFQQQQRKFTSHKCIVAPGRLSTLRRF